MTTFAELLAESLEQNNLRVGSIIRASIVAIGQDAVLVNAGLKSDAVIDLDEFKNTRGEIEVKPGDQIDVMIEAIEDGFGATRLSREKAKRIEAWTELEKAYKNHETITGIIIERVKGGFTVAINNIRAFLPGSLVDVRPVRDPGYLEGKELEFKLIKMDQKRSNIVVSRRAVVEAESGAEREALLDKIEEGQEILGVVKNITDYGAFVDLGGIDGLLHITDMSWKRVKHPSEILNVGDEISVKVLKFDKDKKRVSLGLKQMGEDPWENIARRYPVNTRLFGSVTNIADYGCFVQLEEGIEGLVHMSEMDWTNKNIHPSKVVQLGDEVEVIVLDIDEDRRRISLGIKQCQTNPWEAYSQNHKKDEIIKGSIKSITDFGIFIGLEGGIDGLVHLSDISWTEPGESAVRLYTKGQEVEAIILAIDPDRERISLGVKQLQPDPLGNFFDKNEKGSKVSAKVIEVDAKRAIVDLGNDIQGVIRAGEISNERVNDVRDFLKVDEEVEARILGPDRKGRMVSLSMKDPSAQGSQREAQEGSAPPPSATLGDILKEKMGGGKSES
ncbi:MAG: 30S ribosomal protein S1 [Gammaproteobacteria bacterium]|nr:30S ribosomal protein S1 [Gammaproteobacteria bacterium]